MKSRKLWASIALIVLGVLLSTPVLATFTTNVSSTGLPYNDYEKYRYYVNDTSMYDYGKQSSFKLPVGIMVRDKKTNIILSQDVINITFDGLPLTKEIAKEGEQLKFVAQSRFDFFTQTTNASSEKEVEALWDEFLANNSSGEQTTLFGRPALKWGNGLSWADYAVYLNDVKLPTGIVIFKVSISASINLNALKDTTQGRAFKKKYESEQASVFQDLNSQFNNISIKIEKTCNVRTYEDQPKTVGANVTKNTQASATAGETTVPVAAAVVVAGAVAAIFGAAAAAGGTGGGSAGAAGGSVGNNGDPTDEESGGSTYKMAVNKDFGDKIKYNTDTVYVYARMIEVTPEGQEIDRPELSQNISIFSDSPLLEVGENVMLGSYMGAGVVAGAAAQANNNAEAVISFRFTGEGGVFQNNITFQVVGEAYIELGNDRLHILAYSGKSFELPYSLINFIDEPEELTVNPMSENVLFDLDLGKDAAGKTVIIAADKSEQKEMKDFYDNFSCEIIARNKKEYARTVFTLVVCYEGVLADFLGKKNEIIAYKNEEGEMPITNIAFRVGIWDDSYKKLDVKRPEELDISFVDEEGIFAVLGLEGNVDLEKSTAEYLMYAFKTEISLPSESPIQGTLSIVYNRNNKSFETLAAFKLVPDLLSYEKDRQKEYDYCVKIIDTYMAPQFRARKHRELNAGFDKMGIKDLQLFRKNCWYIASRSIMQEKESYLIDSYWYDEAIATAELLVYVGDVALEVALAPFGGPIAEFVLKQVRDTLIQLISLRVERGSIGFNEIYELIEKRWEQGAGQADNLLEIPGFDKPKALVAWLASYILYRIMYRWYYDVDDNGASKGLAEAIQNGLTDFAGKGASILLSSYVKDIAKKRGINTGSTAEAEREFINDKIKKGLNALDPIAEGLDKRLDTFTATLLDFIDRIRSGGINIY